MIRVVYFRRPVPCIALKYYDATLRMASHKFGNNVKIMSHQVLIYE